MKQYTSRGVAELVPQMLILEMPKVCRIPIRESWEVVYTYRGGPQFARVGDDGGVKGRRRNGGSRNNRHFTGSKWRLNRKIKSVT